MQPTSDQIWKGLVGSGEALVNREARDQLLIATQVDPKVARITEDRAQQIVTLIRTKDIGMQEAVYLLRTKEEAVSEE